MRAKDIVRASKVVLRHLRRAVGLSPMQSVLRELVSRGVTLKDQSALECFAWTGEMHTLDYAERVRSLELWEINARYDAVLRRKFPGARVKTTDTFGEIQRESKRFNLIVVDNSPQSRGHWEHFDLFPDIFRVADQETIFILTVFPELNRRLSKVYPEMSSEECAAARRSFYGIDSGHRIQFDEMARAYNRSALGSGFEVRWWFARRRNPYASYFVFFAARVAETQPQ